MNMEFCNKSLKLLLVDYLEYQLSLFYDPQCGFLYLKFEIRILVSLVSARSLWR